MEENCLIRHALKNKIENFRVEIRKKKFEEIFNVRRTKFIKEKNSSEVVNFKNSNIFLVELIHHF